MTVYISGVLEAIKIWQSASDIEKISNRKAGHDMPWIACLCL